MAVQVDEAWSDNQPSCIDHTSRRGIDHPSHVRDLAVLNGNTALEPRTSTAIDDVSANDQQVILPFLCLC